MTVSSATSTGNTTLDTIIANSQTASTGSTDALGNAITSASGGQTLGEDDFLQLLVTQLQNQDPTNPQDNSAFVAQLAQFSSLQGIQTLNTSVNNIASSFTSS